MQHITSRNPGRAYHPRTSQKFYSFFQASFWNNFNYPLIINVLNFVPQQNYRKSGNTLATLWEQNGDFSTNTAHFSTLIPRLFYPEHLQDKNSGLTIHDFLLSITFPIIINIFVRQKKLKPRIIYVIGY